MLRQYYGASATVASLHRNLRGLEHGLVDLDVRARLRGELRSAQRIRLKALLLQRVLQLSRLRDREQLRFQALHDRRGRALGREKSKPQRHVEIGEALLGDRRYVGQRSRALARAD